MTIRPGRKTLYVQIPTELHEELIAYTDETGITLTKFLIRLITKRLEEVRSRKKPEWDLK